MTAYTVTWMHVVWKTWSQPPEQGADDAMPPLSGVASLPHTGQSDARQSSMAASVCHSSCSCKPLDSLVTEE